MTKNIQHSITRSTARLLTFFWIILLSTTVLAQSTLPVGTTQETLDNRIEDAEAAFELDDTTRNSLLELYRKSLSLIDLQRSHEMSMDEFVRARESASDQAKILREELDSPEAKAIPFKLPDSTKRKSLPELEQQLLTEKTNLTALSAELEKLETVLEYRSQRSTQARDALRVAKKRIDTLIEELELPLPEDELPLLSEASRWTLEHEALALNAEVEMLEQELLSQPMRIELLSAQRDKITVDVKRLSDSVDLLENLTAERRVSEARTAMQQADETQRQASGKHPLVRVFAERNAKLGEILTELANALDQVTDEENRISGQAKRIADNFRLARQKLEIAGLSQVIGQVLLEQSRKLPDPSEFNNAQQRHDSRVADSSLRQVLNHQERNQLRDIADYIEELIAWEPIYEQPNLRVELLVLAEARRELLDKAIAADDTYQQALGELDFSQRQLFETVIAYDQFLNERLLWVRSGELPNWDTVKSILQPLSIFFVAENWQSLASALFSFSLDSWTLILGIVLFAVLMQGSKRIRAKLRETDANIGQLRHDRFSYTLKALAWTILLALRWPILFITVGLHLLDVKPDLIIGDFSSALSGRGEFVPSIGYALYRFGLFAFFFEAFYAICKPYGLTVVHFRWDPEKTAVLAHEIRRLAFYFLPPAFIVTIINFYDPSLLSSGLSRLCVLIVMIALAFFLSRVLAPASGVLREFYQSRPRSPLTWFRYLWVALGLVVPIALAGLAIAGYVYTATQFGTRLVNMLWLIVGLILTNQLIVRWVMLVERRLAFRDALERHRQLRQLNEETDKESNADNEPSLLEEPEIDFKALSDDTTKLINTILTLVAAVGLWVIWSDVLPAFHILDEISLWQYSTMVEGVEKIVPVTLSDAILGLFVILIGMISARRLPALLEMLLLTRLNITAGSRYAITTLTKYAIVAIGVVVVFNLLGGRWSEIQWLIAALGVGIGFGLQEIVANFICGIILLFERPIRIGDTVTVGTTDGTVTKIRMRSTTIRNWDNQELLVPNKEFITGRLLNWTLSDPITRIVIPVGIAYGSDVTKAIELIRQAADEHERILDEPPFQVTFDSFGDSSLMIMLRCFIGSMDHLRPTTSELNQSINSKFEKAGISIAFPQRDIHLDTSQPLDIRLHRARPEAT